MSGIAVALARWGEGLAHALLERLKDVLFERGYVTVQLYVLESKPVPDPCTRTSDGVSTAPANLTRQARTPCTSGLWASERNDGTGRRSGARARSFGGGDPHANSGRWVRTATATRLCCYVRPCQASGSTSPLQA